MQLYRTARRYVAGETITHSNSCENLKSNKSSVIPKLSSEMDNFQMLHSFLNINKIWEFKGIDMQWQESARLSIELHTFWKYAPLSCSSLLVNKLK
jgi:hypothetical protein